jgi:hypothetical protein
MVGASGIGFALFFTFANPFLAALQSVGSKKSD